MRAAEVMRITEGRARATINVLPCANPDHLTATTLRGRDGATTDGFFGLLGDILTGLRVYNILKINNLR